MITGCASMSGIRSSVIEEKTEKLLQPILSRLSEEADEDGNKKAYECVDVEYVKEGSSRYLRIFADKEGGIGINDCEKISRQIEAELDREDFIPDAYILEVSSPGLTRPLKKERDYERNLGKPVEVHLYKPVVSGKDKIKIFIGDLKSYNDTMITLDIGDGKEELEEIERSNISVIKQYVVF